MSSPSLHVAVLGSGSGEPRVHDVKREVELGSRSQLDCLLLQVLTAGLLDSVFVTDLLHTAVERASRRVHKLL